MSDEKPSENVHEAGADDDDIVGEPVLEIRELRDEADPQFFSLVQSRIEEKDLTLNLLQIIFVMPLLFFVELAKAFMPDRPDDESGQGGPKPWNKDST